MAEHTRQHACVLLETRDRASWLQELRPRPPQVGIAPPPPDSPGAPEPAPLERYERPQTLRGLPREVILYQYEVCPFCNKVRAVLDYYKVSLTRATSSTLMRCNSYDLAFRMPYVKHICAMRVIRP